MFQNYFKIALRNLWKSRLFTGLNMLGLSLGLTISLLLFLYIKDELVFDQYHKQAEQIYRVNLAVSFDGKQEKWATAPNIIGPTMLEKIPGVKQQVRFLKHNFGESAFITTGEKNSWKKTCTGPIPRFFGYSIFRSFRVIPKRHWTNQIRC
ncbi:ABC transporter permease [Siphonobacter sp. SORGH_AS_0500]|uniref:ABC transporter permease n=1 Tax=Siphonobacter sp. SORGH_AS_0500 TaxID=1864824 RepID=UPI001E3AE88E|nr:hypothetical protein [Siphonobacter sp. SORGH_AS_0500]